MKKHLNLFGEFYFEAIQALSWKPPFASLMFHDKIETRTWVTQHRGRVLILSSGSSYSEEELKDMCTDKQIIRIKNIIELEPFNSLNGYAIGVGVLYDCRPMIPDDEEKAFVKYNPKLFSHFYRKVQRIEPFKLKGAQKWMNVNDQSILSKIKILE